MILVCGGVKGGSGKTTLATNLTVMRAHEGKRVLLVDADEQRSSSDWADQRLALAIDTPWTTIQLAGKSVHEQLNKMIKNYDDIIVDVGGRDTTSQRSALSIADVFLVPFKPRSLDIWTIGTVKTMISEIKIINAKLKTYALINQADAKGSDNSEAIEVIAECPDMTCLNATIGHRKAFANAAADGLSVVELKILDKKACQEMRALYEGIYNMHTKSI